MGHRRQLPDSGRGHRGVAGCRLMVAACARDEDPAAGDDRRENRGPRKQHRSGTAPDSRSCPSPAISRNSGLPGWTQRQGGGARVSVSSASRRSRDEWRRSKETERPGPTAAGFPSDSREKPVTALLPPDRELRDFPATEKATLVGAADRAGMSLAAYLSQACMISRILGRRHPGSADAAVTPSAVDLVQIAASSSVRTAPGPDVEAAVRGLWQMAEVAVEPAESVRRRWP
jgi:hypothetical protein